jgi:hypothetical protein
VTIRAELPDGTALEFPDGTPDEVIDATVKRTLQERTLGGQAKRQVALTGRGIVNAAAELPLTAFEAGAGVANLASRALGGEGSFSFRQMWEDRLNGVFPTPETGPEKAAQVGWSFLAGSKVPVPTPKGGTAPAGFTKAGPERMRVLADSQKAGYVVPPSHANPTQMNKVLEGFAGKLTTQQLASAKNQTATNSLIKKALGLSDDAPITYEAIDAVRREAGEAYRAIRGAGTLAADTQYKTEVAKIAASYRGASKIAPKLGKSSDIDDLVDDLTKLDQFDADSAVDLLKILRDKQDQAFRGGNSGVGRAYKEAAKSIESLIERNLKASGQDELLTKYLEAREIIAKTYTVEKAFNKATGNVDATKLARELGKGKPLSGEIKQAAEFGAAFPKAARDFNESMPGVSPLDFYASGGTAALAKEPSLLAFPFIRQGMRHGLLTPWAQNHLLQPAAGAPKFANMGTPNALMTAQDQLLRK